MASQQMYLIEIFIDKISIFLAESEENNKNLIIKIIFGPGVEFIVKENELATSDKRETVNEPDANGQKKWTKTIRVGKSYLFPSYPDTVMRHFSKYPLQMEVWNDDENEDHRIFVGVGKMEYDTAFTVYLKDTTNTCVLHPSMSIKSVLQIYAECCCVINGEISYVFRLSALGDNIVTDFQQLLNDPEKFVFRTDKAPSLFECSRIEGEDKQYVTSGGLYELALSEDIQAKSSANKNIDICTELDSCGVKKGTVECKSEPLQLENLIPDDKVRMGDIKGPCGNPSCPLAHKVKAYIRNMHTYKKATADGIYGLQEQDPTRKICGKCSCKDDPHTETEIRGTLPVCQGCGGYTQIGETCQDRLNKLHGTGVTPLGSRTHLINYMIGITYENPDFIKSLYEKDFIVAHNIIVKKHFCGGHKGASSKSSSSSKSSKSNKSLLSQSEIGSSFASERLNAELEAIAAQRFQNIMNVYNTDVSTNKGRSINNFCTEIPDDKECKCNSPKPTAPCKTFDCECMTEAEVKDIRKHHKPYCHLYKHKVNCPVTMLYDEEGAAGEDDEEPEPEKLPYGLPPVQLGPCPVMGRPCTVPDGFARMYKIGAMQKLPSSYSEAGKVCCSKEYERIKKAIKEYMNEHKANDFRCLNKWYVDTETRCCDKEQRLLALLGKSCCGSHKLALNEKYTEEKRP